jgi:hypothetical protein
MQLRKGAPHPQYHVGGLPLVPLLLVVVLGAGAAPLAQDLGLGGGGVRVCGCCALCVFGGGGCVCGRGEKIGGQQARISKGRRCQPQTKQAPTSISWSRPDCATSAGVRSPAWYSSRARAPLTPVISVSASICRRVFQNWGLACSDLSDR